MTFYKFFLLRWHRSFLAISSAGIHYLIAGFSSFHRVILSPCDKPLGFLELFAFLAEWTALASQYGWISPIGLSFGVIKIPGLYLHLTIIVLSFVAGLHLNLRYVYGFGWHFSLQSQAHFISVKTLVTFVQFLPYMLLLFIPFKYLLWVFTFLFVS